MIEELIVILLLTGINVILTMITFPVKDFPIGITPIMFVTVLGGYYTTPMIGFFFGAFTCLLSYTILLKFKNYIFLYVPLYGVMGFIAGLMTFMPVETIGMILTWLYTFISVALVILVFGGDFTQCIPFAVSYIFTNHILFNSLLKMVI